MVFKGSCTTELFKTWLKDQLMAELKPGYTIIMDNVPFHKSSEIREIIEAGECKLLYLPPYSPELNPIEKFWANMKNWIKKNFSILRNPWDALFEFFITQTST